MDCIHFCFAIEPSAPGNFNQILIVCGAVNFGLRGLELPGFVLHMKSSGHMGERDPCESDYAG